MWSPGHVLANKSRSKSYLMELMYILTQFIVYIITFYINPTNLVIIFFPDVWISCIILLVIVINYVSSLNQFYTNF